MPKTKAVKVKTPAIKKAKPVAKLPQPAKLTPMKELPKEVLEEDDELEK